MKRFVEDYAVRLGLVSANYDTGNYTLFEVFVDQVYNQAMSPYSGTGFGEPVYTPGTDASATFEF